MSLAEFDKLYSEVRDVLLTAFRANSNGTATIQDDFLKRLVSTHLSFRGSTEENYGVHEFLFLVLFASNKKALGFDSSRLRLSQFGYDSCIEILESDAVLNGDVITLRTNKNTTLSEVYSIGREVSYADYISGGLYIDDVNNIIDLFKEDSDSDKSETSMTGGLDGEIEYAFDSVISSALRNIQERYSYLMEGTFGVHQYKGIYTGQSTGTMQGIKNGEASIITPDSEFSTKYKSVIDRFIDIDSVADDRQFDVQRIASVSFMNTGVSNLKPIYFPYKVLEIIAKCGTTYNGKIKFTRKSKLYKYRKFNAKDVGSLQNYLKVIDDYFAKIINEFIYRCFLLWCINQEKMDSNDVDGINARIKTLLRLQDGVFKEVERYIIPSLRYFVDCVTTAIVLDICETKTSKTRSGYKLERIIDFRIKVCSRMVGVVSNGQFFATYISMNNLNVGDMQDIAQQTYNNLVGDNFYTADYSYTFDVNLVSCRPTFAYKALNSLKEQGIADLSYKRILLGNSMSNKLIVSEKGSNVNLAGCNVHWLHAGSRSGKGVMGYNIFGTGIASLMPFFFFDRKPDTATVLTKLCPNMFAINGGGKYDATIDSHGVFSRSSINIKCPDYMKHRFINEDFAFDYAYFRSIMLVFSMLTYADSYATTTDLGRKLTEAFGKGTIIVLDEFTNLMNGFFKTTFNASNEGYLSKAKSMKGIVKGLSEMFEDTSKAKTNLAKLRNKKGVSDEEIAIAEDKLRVAESSEYSYDGIYWSAVVNGYKSVLNGVSEKINASGNAIKNMQVFIIGQDLAPVADALAVEDWYNEGAAQNENRFKSTSANVNPLVHLFRKFKNDALIGYNAGKSWLAQNTAGSYTYDKLTEARRCFAYSTLDELSSESLEQIMYTPSKFKSSEAVNAYLNKWTVFKPFLILNNAEEPPEAVRSVTFADDNARNEIRRGLNKANLSDADYQQCIESQFVGQCLCVCEKGGLEWSDLLADNDDGTGHLAQGIGFEGYINELFGAIPTDIMGLSGDLATEFVQVVYGYNGTWKDFIYDFNPEWIVYSVFDKLGGSSVQERLSTTYFAREFVSLNPASKLGSSLGSLLPYYGDMSIGDDTTDSVFDDSVFEDEVELEDFESEGVFTDDGFESTTPDFVNNAGVGTGGDSITPEFIDTTGRINNNSPFFSSLYEQEQQKDVESGWSDSDRLKVAGLMVDAYLLGKKGTSEYAKLADPSIRSVLDKTMLSLLLKRGY